VKRDVRGRILPASIETRQLDFGMVRLVSGLKTRSLQMLLDTETDLHEVVSKFSPRIVKMANEGEQPEDCTTTQ
jgi:hypothetical protein